MNPTAPAPPRVTADGPIVVFDGVCALCNGWVRFLLRRDRRAGFRFAAMQDAVGRELLRAHGLDPDDPVSFLLVDGAAAWHDSAAVIEVLRRLGGGWRLAAGLRIVPRRLRDAGSVSYTHLTLPTKRIV